MKQTVYKLTDQGGYTRRGLSNECKWGPGVTHTAKGEGGLCSSGVIHAYASPLQAVFLNSSHCNFSRPRLWEAEMEITHDDGTKLGGKSLTTLREIPITSVTNEQRAIFAILCVKALKYSNERWNKWADKYLQGMDRTTAAARAAARDADAARDAAYAAAYAADAAAASAAAYAARFAAARVAASAAARVAAYAADAVAAYAAYAAVYAAARDADAVAAYAADAAVYAAAAHYKINIIAIAEEAVKFA